MIGDVMIVPKEFEYLATCFYSRSDLEHETAESWVGSRVKDFLSQKKQVIVKSFLRHALDGSQSDDELARIWASLDSDYWMASGADVRKFFQMIHDVIE
jgi:hypothetical protein